jgi:Putative prokaryotic signal transducing protein
VAPGRDGTGAMKQVLSAPNAAEAHVALAALESAGIEGVIRDEFAGALPLGPISRPTVWVRDEDYQAACDALGVRAAAEPTTTTGSPMKALVWITIALLVGLILTRILQT